MARKYPTDVLEQAQSILNAWNHVGATTNLGTLLPAASSADVTAAAPIEAQIASLESQLTDARNERDALYDGPVAKAGPCAGRRQSHVWQRLLAVRALWRHPPQRPQTQGAQSCSCVNVNRIDRWSLNPRTLMSLRG